MRSLILKAGCVAFSLLTFQSCRSADSIQRAALARGQQFYKKGAWSDAEIQFRRALQSAPQSGEAYLWLGRTQQRRGKIADAFASLKEAAALMPGYEAPRIDLANLMLVAYLADPGRPAALYQEISRISAELLAHDPRSFDGTRLRGYLALADKNPSQAITNFLAADRIRHNEPDVITALIESMQLAGQNRQAEDTALQFLRDKPEYGPIYTMLYQEYLKSGRLPEAESILKSKVEHNPREGLYRIELARHYARVNKNSEMGETLSQMTDHPRDFPKAHMDVGDFFVESRNWQEARRQYEQGAQSDLKSKISYLKRLVRTELAMNDRAAAQRDLEQILQAEPHDPEARASRAALRMAGEDSAQKQIAATEFKALVDESPANADYRFQYAQALLATSQTEPAREQLRLVVEERPGDLKALQLLADLSIRGQHIDDALKYANQVLAIDRESVAASLVKSAALAARGLYSETRSILRPLAREHPELREAQLQLALLDAEEGHYAESENRFLKYYQPGKGDVRSLEGLVELYRAQNRIDRAIALLKEDLNKAPQSDSVRALLARTAAEAGKNDLALQEYRQLALTQPQSPVIALQFGVALQATGKIPEAIAEFDRAARLAPQNGLIYAYRGKALEDSGRTAEAMQSYREGLARDRRNPWLLNNLAFLLADTGGNLEEALKLAHEAIALDSGNSSFSDTLGWVYLKKKDFPSAVHVFQSVRDKSPKEVVYRIHLSQALLATGDRNRSRAELFAARQLPCTQQERDNIGRLLRQTDDATGQVPVPSY